MGLLSPRALGLAVLSCALLLPATASAKTITVQPTGSTAAIQSAVDAANPGDTISVRPGVYTGPTVHVTTSHLTIKGPTAAVIDATGNDYGITVGSVLDFEPGPVCPAYNVSDFTMNGMTVRNAGEVGILLFGVDGLRVTGGRYLDNGEYGIFPRCSRDGRVDHNFASGGKDALIYVGVDDGITIEENHVTASVLGIELENTRNSIVRDNKADGNTVGIFVIVLPGLPTHSTDNALIEDNLVRSNNLPNPFPPVCDANGQPAGCEPLFEDLQLLPSGTGILNVGGHDVTIRDNVVNGNNTAGIGAVLNPIVGVSSDRTRIVDNVAQQNGASPDPRSSGSGDLLYLDDPSNGSCISDNVYKTSFYPFGAPPACS